MGKTEDRADKSEDARDIKKKKKMVNSKRDRKYKRLTDSIRGTTKIDIDYIRNTSYDLED